MSAPQVKDHVHEEREAGSFRDRLRAPSRSRSVAIGAVAFAIGYPLVGFALQSALVRNYEFGQAYSALVMGTLYLLLARVLWHKQLDGMRMLTESFLALAVIFLSLAIPLAMDGHWTAAAWSLEGAGITWVSLRQNRLSGRAFGLLLQVGAGIAFLAAIDLPHGYTPAFNSAFLGSILIGIAGLFTAYQYFVSRDMVRPFEQALHRVLLAWGLAWWFGAGITELEQFVADDYLINALLLYCALSVAALYLLGEKLAWTDTAWPGAGLLPVMAVLAGIGWGDAVLSQPFEKLGYLAWPLAFLVHYLLLYRVRVWPRDLVVSWHAAAQWLLMFLCAWFVSRMLVDHVAGMRSWALVFWGVVPAIIVMLLLNFGTRLRWPIREHAAAYLGGGLLPVIAYLAAWTVVICFRENNPAPLPWVPVLNPYDIAQWFVIFNLFNWCWSLRQGSVPAVAGLRAEPLLMILAAIVFLWLNALVAHTVYFQGGVPFRLYSLMRSEVFQTSISILWTVVALAMMLTATRIHWRRLWFAGGILLGVTLVKLFLVDLADSGTVTRIVSFLTVGGLMLVIGYFSPLPPKHEEDPGAHA